MAWQAMFSLLEGAVAEGSFPGCVAMVWRDGAVVYHEAHGHLATHPGAPERFSAVSRASVYDVASLTKVLATTTLVAIAVSEGRVSLTSPVPEPWAAACPGATLQDLLEHSAGLVAHREFFAMPEVLRRDPSEHATAVLEQVCATPPAAAPGHQAVYSDLGMMIVGAWLERLFAEPLDRAFANRVAWPLGLDTGCVPRLGFHRCLGARGPTSQQAGWVAPTECYDPGLHPGGTPTWFACRHPATVAHYEVHDDNALMMHGVAGHAGLFGDAEAVLTLGLAWLGGGLPGVEDSWRTKFLAHRSVVAGSTRRLGWDSPDPGGTGSTGDVLSQAAAGHLGYTGTSLWLDPSPPDGRGPLAAVLLSNRVHPTRNNVAIATLRPAFHRAAVAL